MPSPYHILYLEDNLADVELVRRIFRREQLPVKLHHAEGRTQFRTALDQNKFDLVLADMSVPGFQGTDAVQEVHGRDPDLPVVIISGTIEEADAHRLLRSGAADYVLKDRLSWLTPVVERALRESGRRQEQREAADALREREASYRALMEFSPDATIIASGDTIALINRNGLGLLGAAREEQVIGRPVWDFLADEDRDRIRQRFEGLLQRGGTVPPEEARLVRLDGTSVEVEFRAAALLYRSHPSVLVAARDISASKAARRALEASEQKFRSLVDTMSEGFVILDPAGTVVYANRKMIDLLGCRPEEILGQPFTQFIADSMQQEIFVRHYAGSHDPGHSGNNLSLSRRDGQQLVVLFSPQRIINEDGSTAGSFAVVTDISEVRRLEGQLRQMQKMESLGTLAGGIAHDFNNILTIILAHASVLKSGKRSPEQQQKSIESIMIASRRGATVVRQILTFARRSETNIEPVSINEIVQELVALIRDTFPRVITVVARLEADMPEVFCDRTQIHQTILNLSVNARDAMLPAGGTLTLTTSVVGAGDLPRDYEGVDAPRHVCIEVCDTGTGMDEETLRRIFEPFFTTKGHAQGTGLGLAVVYGIVQNHRGHIAVRSEPGKGTEFRLFLPVL